MPIDRPRRIFRYGRIAARQNRRSIRLPFLAGLVGVAAAGSLFAVGLPATLFGRVPAVTGTISAQPDRVAVIDGGTLRVQDKVVRLAGIEAPARGTRCAPQLDCGAAAIQALAGLVRDRPVVCRLEGRAPDGFPQARCEAGGTSLNHALVAGGFVRAVAQDSANSD
ncbi:MAG: thermonuclease family protein [Acidisphaera sp.]|nr:thermonuclease family protein [Acidisphaera sp.]